MRSRPSSNFSLFLAVSVSTFIALVLTIIQLPEWLFSFWPDWIALIVIYWALRLPDRIGPLSGFLIGTLLEVVFVRSFGVLGFGMALLAFITNRLHLQLRALSLLPQMLFIAMLITFFKLITGWLYGLIADFSITSDYWYSVIGSTLVWPFVSILLQELKRSARLN